MKSLADQHYQHYRVVEPNICQKIFRYHRINTKQYCLYGYEAVKFIGSDLKNQFSTFCSTQTTILLILNLTAHLKLHGVS